MGRVNQVDRLSIPVLGSSGHPEPAWVLDRDQVVVMRQSNGLSADSRWRIEPVVLMPSSFC
jgi:hypothetical protein